MRKILGFIVGIIGILAVAWLVYFIISRITAPGAVTPKPKLPEKAAEKTVGEPAAAGQLKILSENPLFDYWVASSTQEIFYVSREGKIAKVNPGGQDAFLLEQEIQNLNFVLASPDSQKIIVAFGNAVQPQFSVFDLINNAWSPLPLEIKSLAWSPEGKRLAAVISQNNQTNLAILDLALSVKVIIKNFSLKDLKMDWLRPDEIIFTDKPSSLVMGSAWRLNLSKLNFDEIIAPGNGLMIKWLREDLGIKFQDQKSSLINWAGQVINNFPFIVLPDKCILKSEFLYCFLFSPDNPKINWPDDYLQKFIYTKDGLYQFDLNNLSQPQLIFSPEKTIDASNLKLLDDKILFINRYDNLLYSLEIE